MRAILRFCFGTIALAFVASSVSAKDEKWHVGQHPDYHVALVKQVGEVFVAIYVTKKPSTFLSPVLMETVLAPCGGKKPISLHGTEALLLFGETLEQRASEVRQALDALLERGRSSCDLAEDLEDRFFSRFEDAYKATDTILVEAGIFPLKGSPFETPQATEDEID